MFARGPPHAMAIGPFYRGINTPLSAPAGINDVALETAH